MKEILVCKNGELVGVYPSVARAAKTVKTSPQTVKRCIETGGKSKLGYTFDYPIKKGK